MHAVFSLVFLTTLVGVGQGLYLALFAGQLTVSSGSLASQSHALMFGGGNFLALAFLLAGLVASTFHLSSPLRAWRAITQWRTSWLSREVTLLPLFMLLVFLTACFHAFGWEAGLGSTLLGLVGAIVGCLLFVCTAMIYAELNFVREWSSPLTIINFILLGCASGFTLATAFSSYAAIELVQFYSSFAIVLTVCAAVTRITALIQNNNQSSALEIADNGSYGSLQWLFIALVLAVPVALLLVGSGSSSTLLFSIAFIAQYLGLIAERWLFFEQVSHPQARYQGNFG
jgi:DMSO reductase anchor subunit